MKYEVSAEGTTIEVESVHVSIFASGAEAIPELQITVSDNSREIYTDDTKKQIWAEWVNACLEDKKNPEGTDGRMRNLEVKIIGGASDEDGFRTFKLANAYPLSYTEHASEGQHSYQITFAKGPRKRKGGSRTVELLAE